MIRLKQLLKEATELDDKKLGNILKNAFISYFDIDEVYFDELRNLLPPSFCHQYIVCNLIIKYKNRIFKNYIRFYYFKFPFDELKGLNAQEWQEMLKQSTNFEKQMATDDLIKSDNELIIFQNFIREMDEKNKSYLMSKDVGEIRNSHTVLDLINKTKKIIDKYIDGGDDNNNKDLPVEPINPTNKKLVSITENKVLYHSYYIRNGKFDPKKLDFERGLFAWVPWWLGKPEYKQYDEWGPNEFGDTVVAIEIEDKVKTFVAGDQYDALEKLLPKGRTLTYLLNLYDGQMTKREWRIVDGFIGKLLKKRKYKLIHYTEDQMYGETWTILDPSIIIKYWHKGEKINEQNSSDLNFINPEVNHPNEKPLEIDIEKIDKFWKLNKDFYIGPNGNGGIGNRYERFKDFLKTKEPIQMPQIYWDEYNQNIGFSNGRHRFAVLRDMGVKKMSVMVPIQQIDFFKHNFI